MLSGFSHVLKGLGGEYEINRVVGAFGAATYVVAAHVFEAWNMWRGVPFDVTAYCLAFPGGLGVAVASIAGAVALKDRSVATARATDAATAQTVQDTEQSQ